MHSDFNPKNLLIDPETLDGHRPARLGVRPRRSSRTPTWATCCASTAPPGYVDAVLTAYCRRRGGEAQPTLDLARAADLWALVDLAAQPLEANLVRQLADDLLREIATTRDLHAAPWPQ